jgi:hypothetical protein
MWSWCRAPRHEAELLEHARAHVREKAAVPKHVEVLPELPKTAVGKIFKPDLRKLAIRRVYDQALGGATWRPRWPRWWRTASSASWRACADRDGREDEVAGRWAATPAPGPGPRKRRGQAA